MPFDIAKYSDVISNKNTISQSPENLKNEARKGLEFLKKKLKKEDLENFKKTLDNLDPNNYRVAVKDFARKANVRAMDMDYKITYDMIKGERKVNQYQLMKLWTKAMYTIVEKAKELNMPYKPTADYRRPSDFGVENHQRFVVHGGGGRYYNGWTRGETVPVENVMKYI